MERATTKMKSQILMLCGIFSFGVDSFNNISLNRSQLGFQKPELYPQYSYRITRRRQMRLQCQNVGSDCDSRTKDSEIVTYDYLNALRDEIDELRLSLHSHDDDGEKRTCNESRSSLENEIKTLERKDPEFMYASICDKLEVSTDENEIGELRKLAEMFRSRLPHFNLEGLWVGKFSSEIDSFDFIEISYKGNSLVATKRSGEGRSVPVGEISFKADLTPSCFSSEAATECLLPLQLPENVVDKWQGSLVRFPGKGQIADENYENPEWIDGELIMVDETHYIFVWESIKYQIFFTRPPRHLWREDEFGPYPLEYGSGGLP